MKKLLGMISLLTLALVISLPLSAGAAGGAKGKAPEPSPMAKPAPEPAPVVQPAPPAPAPEAGGVSVGVGDLRISGIFQAVGKFIHAKNNNTDTFDMKRARIFLIGSIVPDKVKYVFQGDAANSPWLLDARIIFVDALPSTDIQVGRFLPNYTYYMPQLVSKLDFIEYPLLTSTFAMWRQVGLQSTTKFSGGSFNFGLLNSSGLANSVDAHSYQNTWTDGDNWKSLLLRGNLNPSDNVQTSVYFVTSRERATATEPIGAGEYWTVAKAGGFLKVSGNGLTTIIEGLFAKEGRFKGYAVYAQAGYKPSDKVEALVRFDMLDPYINDSLHIRPTLGINYYISGTDAMIYLNYFIDKYSTAGSNAVHTVEAQAQVAF